MYDWIAATATGVLQTFGLGILLVVFALEGALIGKLIPTRALFVAAVLALGTDALGIVSVFLAAVVGGTVGQLVLFTLIRRTDIAEDLLPGSVGKGENERLQDWVDRWGVSAIAVSNVLPVVRGTLTVPAAMGDASTVKFSTAAVFGTALYAGSLVVLAVGLTYLLAPL